MLIQKDRNSRLIKKTKSMWQKVNIDINPQIGARMLQVFARDQLFNLKQSETCSQLGYFSRDLNRWKILNLLMLRSAKGEVFYKSQAIKMLKTMDSEKCGTKKKRKKKGKKGKRR